MSLVGPAVLSVAWPTFGADLARTGFAAGETQLTPAVAAGLREVWSARLGGVLDAQPVVGDGIVVAASENGAVAGIDLASGSVRWRRRLPSGLTKCHDTPGGRYGVSATPVIGGARVYAAANDGRIYALSLRSGKTVAGWPVRALKDSRLEHVWGALTLSRGRLYVPSASHCDNAYYHGEIVAIDVRRHRMAARWSAVPGGHGGGVWAWGGLAVDAGRRLIYGATANAQGRGGEARKYGERVVVLDTRLRLRGSSRPKVRTYGDADFGGHPVLIDAQGCPPLLLVGHKEGALFLYDRRHVARGPLQRVQAGDRAVPVQLGTYAWWPAQRTLYFANAAKGPLSQGLDALRLGGDCRLQPRWQLPLETAVYRATPPSISAGGLVVTSGGTSGRVYVADARSGDLLRTLGPVPHGVFGGIALAGGTVLVPGWDGRLHAFAAP